MNLFIFFFILGINQIYYNMELRNHKIIQFPIKIELPSKKVIQSPIKKNKSETYKFYYDKEEFIVSKSNKTICIICKSFININDRCVARFNKKNRFYNFKHLKCWDEETPYYPSI